MKGKADTSKKSDAKQDIWLKVTGKRKKAGGAGKPKRPPSAFFVFLSEFRQEFQQKNPHNKGVAAVSKAAGEKWRAMSEEEKAPYVAKAGKKKQDYETSKATHNNKESTSSKKPKVDEEEEEEEDHEDPEGSDKSKSEVEDDEHDGSGEDGDEE